MLITVGSSKECMICVDDETVSRRHCIFEINDQEIWIEDLGSSNGTYVNQVKVRRQCVRPEDKVFLGDFYFDLSLIRNLSQREELTLDSEQITKTYSQMLDVEISHIYLDIDDLTLGSAPDCYLDNTRIRTHINIGVSRKNQQKIAQRHVRVYTNCGKMIVEDLRTKHGTKVYYADSNTWEPLQLSEVQADDIIKISDRYFQFSSRLKNHDASEGQRIDVKGVFFETIHTDTQKPFHLIHDVNFSALSGEVIAIMGPSGSGKTTLLNCIAGINIPTQGEVLLNGRSIFESEALNPQFGRLIGHAPQFDAFHASLTVKECLMYTAELRAPANLSAEERAQCVQRAIRDVGLQGYENVLLGSSDQKSLSGGQRKRVNIAMELVAGCEVLLLDEPTSGLSSSDSAEIIRLLRLLAKRDGKTVILTLHQPAYESFIQIDYLLLLEEGGYTSYFGPTAIDSFNFFGVDELNVDRLLEVISEKKDKNRKSEFVERFERSGYYKALIERAIDSEDSEMNLSFPVMPSRLRQLWILLRRQALLKKRDWGFFSLLFLFPSVITAAFTLVMGSELKEEILDHYRVEHGMLVILTIMICFFGSLGSVLEIVSEKTVWRREKRANISSFAYLSSKIILYGLVSIVFPLLSLKVCFEVSSWGNFKLLSHEVWSYTLPLIITFLAASSAGLFMSSWVATMKSMSYTLAINAAVFYSIVQIVFAVFAPIHVTFEEDSKTDVLQYASAVTTARWSMSHLLTSYDLCRDLEAESPLFSERAIEKALHLHICKMNYMNSGIYPVDTTSKRTSSLFIWRSYAGNIILTLFAWLGSFLLIRRIT